MIKVHGYLMTNPTGAFIPDAEMTLIPDCADVFLKDLRIYPDETQIHFLNSKEFSVEEIAKIQSPLTLISTPTSNEGLVFFDKAQAKTGQAKKIKNITFDSDSFDEKLAEQAAAYYDLAGVPSPALNGESK